MSARRSTALVAAVVAVVSLGLAPAASASTARPNACPADPAFSFSGVRSSHIAAVPYSQGPGGHLLSIQLSAGISATATFTGTVAGGASILVASADTQVSASLAVSVTANVTYGDSWTVPAGVSQGYLDAGASSDYMNWSKGSYNGACAWVVSASGTLNSPYHLPAFWSWTS